MVLAERADRVPVRMDALHRRRIRVGHGADEEKRHLDALRVEDIEDLLAVGRQRAVIKSENHLLVAQRQRLGVLHHAETSARFDGDRAACSERVRIPGAILRPGRYDRQKRAGGHAEYGENQHLQVTHAPITGPVA